MVNYELDISFVFVADSAGTAATFEITAKDKKHKIRIFISPINSAKNEFKIG